MQGRTLSRCFTFECVVEDPLSEVVEDHALGSVVTSWCRDAHTFIVYFKSVV